MRGIRGWIMNLPDGGAPAAGSVSLSAIPRAKPPNQLGPLPLDKTIHRLGALVMAHRPGSADDVHADQQGHFGWDMELSPGAIDLEVIAHDPEPYQHHYRKPDESAQIGKAFITDLERLGWAGGRDGLIWDGVYGGMKADPASTMSDPTASWYQGNWAVTTMITSDPGRVLIHKGIAMLAGTVFSVELGDLMVPVDGDAPMPANGTGVDRWDMVSLRTDWNPLSPEYGKQSIEIQQGGATIPPSPGNVDNYRRLPLHAIRMQAGKNFYDTAYDLRQWLNPPPGVVPYGIQQWYQTLTPQLITTSGNTASTLNTTMALASQEIIVPTASAWGGQIHLVGVAKGPALANSTFDIRPFFKTEGFSAVGQLTPADGSANLVIPPPEWPAIWAASSGATPVGGTFVPSQPVAFHMTYPLARIPLYTNNGITNATSRTWHRLRLSLFYEESKALGSIHIAEQAVLAHLWPVP